MKESKPCGCKVRQPTNPEQHAKGKIVYCPTHLAAFQMKEALEEVRAALEERSFRPEYACITNALIRIDKALRATLGG